MAERGRRDAADRLRPSQPISCVIGCNLRSLSLPATGKIPVATSAPTTTCSEKSIAATMQYAAGTHSG